MYEQLFLSFYGSTLAMYRNQYHLFGDSTVLPLKVLCARRVAVEARKRASGKRRFMIWSAAVSAALDWVFSDEVIRQVVPSIW